MNGGAVPDDIHFQSRATRFAHLTFGRLVR